jgi:DNA polymerase III subunit alpha
MAGVVRRRQERTAAGGGRFAFVSLSDPTGEYEALFPPEALRRVRELLEPGSHIVIKARARTNEGEVRFFADDAEPLDRAVDMSGVSLRVHVAPAAADATSLRQRLRPAERGGGDVVLVAPMPGGRELELKLPGRYVLDAAARGAIKSAPGVTLLEEA